MIKLAAWTSVAAIAAAFGFGGVSAEAHSPAGYCASHPTHIHCPPPEDPPDPGGYPNVGNFLGPFVALGTCNPTAKKCELAKVGDYCEVDADCQGEINGKAAMNSYGLYLVETIGLEPYTDYDVCLVGTDLSGNPVVQSLNDNAGTDASGKLSTDGRLDALLDTTIIQPSIQIILDPVYACDSAESSGPIVQETGLSFFRP